MSSFWAFFLIPFLLTASECYTEQTTKPAINELSCATAIPIRSLEELSSRYDGFLLDAFGVFWGSNEVGVLPGAAAAMEYLVSQGKQVGILSNTTQRAANEKEKLEKHGLYEGVHYHFLLTSGEFAKELLLKKSLPFPTPHCTYWVFGSVHPRSASHLQVYEGTEYRETKDLIQADFIHISVPHIKGVDQENPEVFRSEVQAVANLMRAHGRKIPVLCINPDRFAQVGSPPQSAVRQGSIAQMFAELNIPVYWLGKPSKIIFEAALERFSHNLSKKRIIMIGDNPTTDVRGAHTVGLDAALITKTGVMANLFEKKGVGPVIATLQPHDKPQFLLERFGLTR